MGGGLLFLPQKRSCGGLGLGRSLLSSGPPDGLRLEEVLGRLLSEFPASPHLFFLNCVIGREFSDRMACSWEVCNSVVFSMFIGS